MSDPGNMVVAGTSLVCFAPGTLPEEKYDILDCLAYSDIRASARHNRKRFWSQWINEYQLQLYKNGFKITDTLPSDRIVLTNPRDLASIVGDSIEASGNPALEKLARSSLKEVLGNPDGKYFFRDWFSTQRNESMQIIPCCKDERGRLDVLVCGFELTIGTTQGSWFADTRSKIAVSLSGGVYRYSAQAYSPYRDKVASFLEEHTGEVIRANTWQGALLAH